MAPSTDDSLDYNAHLAFFERILIAGGLISVATVSYLALGPTMTDYFQYHPIFISMAFYFCMPLSLWYGRIGSRSLTIGARRQLLWRHLVISIGFSVFSICSFLAINAQKNHMKKQHYTSWHGFCGITVYIIIWLQSLVGFLRYFKPPVAASVQRFGRTIHSIAGHYVVPLASILVISLGMQSNWAVGVLPTAVRLLFTVIPFALVVTALYAPLPPSSPIPQTVPA